MIYFKTVQLPEQNTADVEKAIRKYSARREASLDFYSALNFTDTDKMFLGYEHKNDLQITRIKSPMAKYLPTIIANFPSKDFSMYKMRLTFQSLIVLSLVSLFSIILIFQGFKDFDNGGGRIFFGFILLGLIIGLILTEIRLTQNQIEKAVFKS